MAVDIGKRSTMEKACTIHWLLASQSPQPIGSTHVHSQKHSDFVLLSIGRHHDHLYMHKLWKEWIKVALPLDVDVGSDEDLQFDAILYQDIARSHCEFVRSKLNVMAFSHSISHG
jgi:hypothetical protein